jgi:HNH endonuclease
MPFPESILAEVRKRAAFRCCRCHEPGIDAHHITPASEGGPDTIDNAAPLCQNCHDRFGDNKRKRKEIRQMRDWWYEVVEEKWPRRTAAEKNLNKAVLAAEAGKIEKATGELQKVVVELERRLEQPGPSEIREVASRLVSATKIGEGVYANVKCHRCGQTTGLSIGATACPNCGAPHE